MQLNNKLYYYEIANAREQCLVAVHINGDKDLTDILDKMRKKESESERGGKSFSMKDTVLWSLSILN